MLEECHLKVVVVGDGAVGKTGLLLAYTQGSLPLEYVPTAFDNYIECCKKHSCNYVISFWDTAGHEEYHKLRPMAYTKVNVFLVCFNVVDRTSYNRVLGYWMPEIKQHCGSDVPCVLVGLQTDLRATEANKDNVVSEKEGQLLAERLGMIAYCECSAKTCQGCEEVVHTAITAASTAVTKSQNKENCCIML